MIYDGSLLFNTKVDEGGLASGVQNVNTYIGKAKNSLKSLAKAAAAAFSVATVTNFAKECVELGSDLAEVQNVVDVTFSTMSAQADEWAKSAASAFGLSETMAKKYLGTFGSMAEAFGFSESEAYDMSTALTGLAGDVASFYNITQDEAYTKLKSVFSGETETLKDLGIVMTQSALDNYALANSYGKTVSEMTEAEKVSLRFAFVQDQLANATGDFTRTQDSWANQTRILQLRFDSLKATLGQGLINVFSPLLKNLNAFIEKLGAATEKFKAFTEQVFGYTSAGSTSTAADEVSEISDEAETATEQLSSAADEAEEIKENLQGFDELNVMSLDDDSDSTETAETAAEAAQTAAEANAEAAETETTLEKNTNRIIKSISNALDKLKPAFASIGDSWKKVWQNGTGEKVLSNIKQLAINIFDIIGDIASAFTSAWNKAGLGDSVVQSIIDKWNSLIELINTVAEDFRTVWNDGTGERIWTNILTIIRNCNNATKTLREKIKAAWDKNDTGKRIWTVILGIVEDITGFLSDMTEIRLEWLESLDLSPLVTAVADLGEAFRELLKACGNKLKSVYEKVLLPLAKWTIEKVVPTLVEALADALKLLGKIINSISDDALYAIAGGITAVATAVVAFKAGQTIATGINAIRTAMQTLLTTVTAHPILAIASAIAGLVTAVITYNELKWSNSEAGKFAEEIDGIKSSLEETTAAIEDNLSSTLETLDNMYADNTLIDTYQEKLNELLEKAELSPEEQSQLQTIVTYFENNVDGFETTWDRYVTKSDDGTYHLKSSLSEVQEAINSTIDEYQRLANASALSELSAENSKTRITASKDYAEAKEEYDNLANEIEEKTKEADEEEKQLKEWLKKNNKTYDELVEEYNRNGELLKQDSFWGEAAEMYYDIEDKRNVVVSMKSELSEAADAVNETIAAMNTLTMTGDDLSDVQNVLNGDYSDAAAVLMAYNAGLISATDVQNSQWESINKLTKAAEETGKNTVIGLVDGTNAYKDALVENSNGLANLILSEYDSVMDINSPSQEMYDRGVWTVEGLVNGLSDNMPAVKSVFSQIWDGIKSVFGGVADWFKDKFSKAWQAVKDVFSTGGKVFDGIKDGIVTTFKTVVNAIITGINKIIAIPFNSINGFLNTLKSLDILGVKPFDWIGSIDVPQIPTLATGTVVPANYGEFLAVLGDNKREAEVVSPISAMKQAMSEVLAEFSGSLGGTDEQEIVINIDGDRLFDVIVKHNDRDKRRRGRSRLA